MTRCSRLAALAMALAAGAEAAAPPAGPREFTKEEIAWWHKAGREVSEHASAGRFEEAEKLAQAAAELLERVLGRNHWQTRDARLAVEGWRRLTKVPKRKREMVWQAIGLNRQGLQLRGQGRSAEALKRFRKAREAFEEALGEAHPHVAESHSNAAACLVDLGKPDEALPLARKALRIDKEALGESHPATATSYNVVAFCLKALGESSEALPLYRKALEIRQKALGERHPSTATSYNNLAGCLADLGKVNEALPLFRKVLEIRKAVQGERHPDTAACYTNVAYCLRSLGKASEALPLARKALEINKKALPEGHPDTAACYDNVAHCLHTLGKPGEALPLARKALEMRKEVLGERHPAVAKSYGRVAACLEDLGEAEEALPLHRKALEINEAARGERHPSTANGYNSLAHCLHTLGKASEALPLYRKALLIRAKALGERHPDVATSYNNVASCLHDLGEPSEALPLYEKALALDKEIMGERHPSTATTCNNLATCLHDLGKPKEALPLYEMALKIRKEVLGERHPQTLTSYNNVAVCLDDLGKSKEALPLFRKALEIRQEAQGERHPETAGSYNNVAWCLGLLGKSEEALPLFRKALKIRKEVLGEHHPLTANSYNDLALCLWRLGEFAQAARLWQQSLDGQEAARFRHHHESGFARAAAHARGFPPRAALAVGLARLGQPRNAFAQAEASLARGLLDDMASPNSEDAVRVRALQARLGKLDAELVAFASLTDPDKEQRARHKAAVREQRAALEELERLVAAHSARQVLPLWRIQKAIPDDAALVLWIGAQERWGCVVRHEGAPLWTRLPGSGEKGALTADDKSIPSRLHAALTDPDGEGADREKLSARFVKLFFDPLRPHLKGVKGLLVVPVGPPALIPLGALKSDYTISYVPSGSVLARLSEKHRAVDGSSLLALGDATFDRATPPTPPASGVLILSVLPGGVAAKADLRPGDVLLEYDGVKLKSLDDLKGAIKAEAVVALRWREGKEDRIKLGGGRLGVIVDPRPSRAAVRAWREGRDAVAGPTTGHKRLPGTRAEVEAIAKLVKSGKTLLGSDASEQKLDELQAKGELKKFRLIHLATHGETDERVPARSAVILAQDDLPDPLEQVRQNKKVYDGRLTVSAIRDPKAGWDLDADLVVLSACETGLGQYAEGDGLLGFTQALIHKGARAVVLSRWKVDDTATALLMVRFYENLLGKREGLKKPLGRAAALAEAAKWLRELSRADAEKLAAHLAGGTLRDTQRSPGQPIPKKAKGKPAPLPKSGDRPFAHPHYWAAFVLVGDPE